MKRGKEDEKPMSPMFPRLHVNEREKGGPRAPPRNKMALYEQLSIPSQRFNSGMSSNNNNSSATSSSQVSGNKRPLFSPLQLPRSTPQADTANASSSDFRPSFSAPRKRVDEEDFAVPVFVEPENGQNSKHSDTVDRNFLSLSRPPQINTPSRNQTTCLNSPSPPEDHESRDVDELQSSNEGLNHEVIDGPQLENMQNISSNGEHYKEKTKYSPGIQNGNRCDDDSDTSMVDSASGVCITPDEVVGVIGQKHFWKARRAIVNQQRVFAVQVFELHRLIKVQKSFAGSPNLLHEDTTSVRKTLNTSIPKQISLEFIIKPPAKIDNLKEDYLNNSPNSENKEGSADNTVPRSSISNQIQFPSSNAQAPPVTSDPSANPWYVNQPTGQQWLVPVMSPTEGLIYKPYAGPDHTGSNPMMSNFSYPTYGSPYSYPQGVPNIYQFFQGMGIPPNYPSMTHHGYFPSYGMPYMGPTISGSVVNQQQQNSYSGQTQQMNNNSTPNVENSARTMMGSTVSSPPEESNNGNSMLLPNNQGDGVANENLTRAIKVVPHNAVSANETAFRIFQSIQKEREEQNEESA